MKKYNFNAGPAILPAEVLRQASAAVGDLDDTGLSILEISHRSKEFQAVMDEAVSLVKELYSLPKEYEVMFLQGGASSQFFMSSMNLLGGQNSKAAYIDTGSWSSKAIKEAQLFGQVDIVGSSKDAGYTFIPKNVTVDSSYAYLHLTSNNTICGTQFHAFPEGPVKIVADMSSDILSREIPIDRFGIIYAGAQKNLGPAGATLVIVDKTFVDKPIDKLPTMLNYHTHISKGSMFNTPPVFAIYVSMLVLRWIKAHGGLKEMDKRNTAKAKRIYDVLDKSTLFEGIANPEDRSKMNITFLLKNENLTSGFLSVCQAAGCVGVKGHRSVGGFRASIYNAMSLEGVEVLASVMEEFEKTHA